jgi:hypothetical protein
LLVANWLLPHCFYFLPSLTGAIVCIRPFGRVWRNGWASVVQVIEGATVLTKGFSASAGVYFDKHSMKVFVVFLELCLHCL